VWAETLDGGRPGNKVAHQDRVVTLAAPLAPSRSELTRLAKR